jgi:hypothetical protein
MSNALRVLRVYRNNDFWVFDDAAAGLEKEPFVLGIDRMIDILVEKVPGSEEGFNLLFSPDPFPGHQVTLVRMREEYGGNWYHCNELDFEGWLCPALYKYFDKAPEHLYVEALPRPEVV